MSYLSHYNWNTCEVVSVDEPPAAYEYMLKYTPPCEEWNGDALVELTDFRKGIKHYQYIPAEEVEYFEPANVAASLCHRAGFCMERPARYEFACEGSPRIMFISKRPTPSDWECMEWNGYA